MLTWKEWKGQIISFYWCLPSFLSRPPNDRSRGIVWNVILSAIRIHLAIAIVFQLLSVPENTSHIPFTLTRRWKRFCSWVSLNDAVTIPPPPSLTLCKDLHLDFLILLLWLYIYLLSLIFIRCVFSFHSGSFRMRAFRCGGNRRSFTSPYRLALLFIARMHTRTPVYSLEHLFCYLIVSMWNGFSSLRSGLVLLASVLPERVFLFPIFHAFLSIVCLYWPSFRSVFLSLSIGSFALSTRVASVNQCRSHGPAVLLPKQNHRLVLFLLPLSKHGYSTGGRIVRCQSFRLAVSLSTNVDFLSHFLFLVLPQPPPIPSCLAWSCSVFGGLRSSFFCCLSCSIQSYSYSLCWFTLAFSLLRSEPCASLCKVRSYHLEQNVQQIRYSGQRPFPGSSALTTLWPSRVVSYDWREKPANWRQDKLRWPRHSEVW